MLPVLLSLLAAAPVPPPADTTPRIDRITLDRRNIFDDEESGGWLTRLVNRLHVRTRAPLVRREFLFARGEPLDSARLAETKRNLVNLGVFRDVAIDTVRGDSGLTVRVVTRDGWSTRPDFRFRSTGGSIAYTAALIEDNLLGTITKTELLYRKDPDRTTTVLSFRRPRMIAGTVGAAFQFANRSDGELVSALLYRPYFSIASTWGASLAGDLRRERVFRFRGGEELAGDTLQRRYALLRLDAGRALRASSRGYVRAGLVAQLRRDDYALQADADEHGIGSRTITGSVGGYVEWRRADFLETRGYQSFGRPEFVDLSRVVRVSLIAAPAAFGYDRGGVAPGVAVHSGLRFPGGFAFADVAASGLFDGAGLDSGRVEIGGTAVLVPHPRHQILVHAEAGMLRRPLPGSEFDLGLGAGPRAFREHAFTGDRQRFATAEYRFTAAPDLFKLTGVGLAAFVDHGGAWWHGERPRSGWDAGVGLRLGPSRAPDQEASRIDFAWRFATDREPAGWVLVVGKGFVFATGLRGRN